MKTKFIGRGDAEDPLKVLGKTVRFTLEAALTEANRRGQPVCFGHNGRRGWAKPGNSLLEVNQSWESSGGAVDQLSPLCGEWRVP